MDAYEATQTVMSRIQSLEPENASKIMGYILIQDQSDKEMIRLAFGPETLLRSHINQAKSCLGLISDNPPSKPSTPHSANPFSPNTSSSFAQVTAPRILISNSNNSAVLTNMMMSCDPSLPASNNNSLQRSSPRPFSYASALSGPNHHNNNNTANSSFGSSNSSSNCDNINSIKEQLQFSDDSFMDHHPIMSPSGGIDSLVFPFYEDNLSGLSSSPHQNSNNPFHRRSCSVNDAAFISSFEDGYHRPCMYFARGFCKNGSTCKFLHSDDYDVFVSNEVNDNEFTGSPSNKNLDGFLRAKAAQQQQQRLALMASGDHQYPFGLSKCMDFPNESPRSIDNALMMGDEFLKLNRYRHSRSDHLQAMRFLDAINSSSRQIYLTFPADSTFKEEDVSNYFRTFGPVQDVRIPYQQKRMFGFVTFVYPETVKLILAKGNPHFVCDSRVLVKPYKEKGKLYDRKQHYSNCLSPTGVNSREHHFDNGSRTLFSTQEMILRRKLELETEELQHAVELQSQRMMNLRLMDHKNRRHHCNNDHLKPSLIHYSSPRQSTSVMNQNSLASYKCSSYDNSDQGFDIDVSREANESPLVAATDGGLMKSFNGVTKQPTLNGENSDLPVSFELALPDNLFGSPTKLTAEEHKSIFSHRDDDHNKPVIISSSNNTTPELPCSSLTMASLNTHCNVQMPRFSSGQEAIEM